MAFRMESVTWSAYITTWPSTFRAARPMVWMSAVSERRKPSLSASRMATNDTSGRSRPSRRRLMPTSTSNSPSRRPRRISTRWMVSMSEWRYRTRMPSSRRYSVRSSDIFLVRVVTSTRWSAASRARISATRSSIWPLVGPDHDLRVHQPGRPDDLLHHPGRHLHLERRRGGAHEDDLPDPLGELLEPQGPVVHAPMAAGTRARPACPCGTCRPRTGRGAGGRRRGTRR